jgi:YegS/Rv2252/BmrU family lipid kinase
VAQQTRRTIQGVKTLIVVNPTTYGRQPRRWRRLYGQIRDELPRPFEVAFTQRPLHATQMTRDALSSGYGRIVALGGDGSINEVMNGFFENDAPVNPDAVLGVLPWGTGNDFVKMLGIPQDLRGAARALRDGDTRIIDVGKTSFVGANGQRHSRYFVNVADFGMGGLVMERVNQQTESLGGRLKFLWGIFDALPEFRSQPVQLSIDDGSAESLHLYDVVVANGRYFGGGLCPAPLAELDDGLLDIICFGQFSKVEVVLNLGRLRNGTHLDHPKVRHTRGRRIWADSPERVLLEIDGETVGQLPAAFEIVPQILPVFISPYSTSA